MTASAASPAPDIASLPPEGASRKPLGPLALGAIGIVFGDIGTSPLYTMKTVLALGGGAVNATSALGVLSLLLWTLFIITTVKYVNIAMRIDNDGEGGILALMALLGIKKHNRPAIVALGLFGAALIYGDGAITPAISVLSAIEGLNTATPQLAPYVLPLAVAILVALFALQPLGTARIGKAFGPIMAVWFVTIAALGLANVIRHPRVFLAINPYYGLHYLYLHGLRGFLLLGGVFLCVTGAEALYADMGHFGARPIRLAWSWLVFPALVINYAGQAALLVSGAPVGDNIFYALAPAPLLLPVILLATVATIIASQSIITGAFSMTRQAIQLGWLPRLTIKQTSAEGYGQIYVGIVNWALMIVTVALALLFRKSDNLAAAYGIAVSMTMMMTSALLYMAMREIWNWGAARAGAVAGTLFVIDACFFAANSTKLREGGYVPLMLAIIVYGVMWVWHRGSQAVAAALADKTVPFPQFLADIVRDHIPRVPGTAVFLTGATANAPSVLLWHVRQNRALCEKVLILHLQMRSIPYVGEAARLKMATIAPDLWVADVDCGFMERLDIPAVLALCRGRDCAIDTQDVTYYLGHETILAREDSGGLPGWIREIFIAMARNSARMTGEFRLPTDQVVEIGRTVQI